jgi:hypothetical protein
MHITRNNFIYHVVLLNFFLLGLTFFFDRKSSILGTGSPGDITVPDPAPIFLS